MDYKNELQSDDDFDCSNGYNDSYSNGNGQTRMSNSNGLSKAELRKTNKPIMEKRRRARINHCLNELKSLILEAMKKDPARHTKLEKADILEMTVKHLQSVQRQQLNMAIQTDPTVIHKFKTGFIECAEEVNRYISQLDGVDAMVRQRLTNHLNSCATSLEQIGSMSNFNSGYRGQLTAGAALFGSNPLALSAAAATTVASSTLFPTLPQDLNNNSNCSSSNGQPAVAPIQMGGVQLIPSRLPSGEFALIMPNTQHAATAATAANLLNNNNAAFNGWPHGIGAPAAAAASTTAAATPLANDFAANFKRLSAFSKPPTQATTNLKHIASNNANSSNTLFVATHNAHNYQQSQQQQRVAAAVAHNSPPLSPISSLSSHGDDSLMHTSSDFTGSRPATPPHDASSQQHSFSGVFCTPPSAESSALSSAHNTSSSSSLALCANLQQQQVSSTSGSQNSSANESTGSLKRALEHDEAEEADSSDAVTVNGTAPAPKKQATEAAVMSGSKEKRQATTALKERCGVEERDNMWRPW